MKIVKIYLFCVIGLAGLCAAIPVRAMQESPINIEQLCFRCANMQGVQDFNTLYRCKTSHPEKLCKNCYDFLTGSSKKGKNPAQCPICGMNSWKLSDSTPFELTEEEAVWISETSNTRGYYDAGSSSGSSSRSFIYQNEAHRSLKIMYLCMAAITVGLGKYVWHKLKKDRKNLPTEQAPITPDATKNE